MKELTERQFQILEFIQTEIQAKGLPPTVAEITHAMGVNSTNGIRGHLQALERKGVIELIPNSSRGIRLLNYDEIASNPGLPVVGRVAAGNPILAEENIEDYCQIERSTFRPSADYLLRVDGMSMRDVGILNGDLLAVHRQASADNGQIVVARIDDEVTVKRLHVRGNVATLKAENPDFAPIKVNLRHKQLYIEGIAVGVLRQTL